MPVKPCLCLSLLLLATACGSTLDRLESIGKEPPLTRTDNPQTKPDYAPVTWPLPHPAPPETRYSNSLWQPGARAFFRDQRAARIGDILTVNVTINDRAELANESERTRDVTENIAAPDIYGLESLYGTLTPGTPNPQSLFNISGSTTNTGEGSVEREERIETRVAAVITQVLPNGNFVIHGSQEVRVNFEVREIVVSGIIRPEDIGSNNTIASDQIAEARITYGGRGQMTDVQQPRWGHQVIDVLSPF
ncbi:MAG: flagellar basal body L-ring protein FlgH [Sphaerospermopsis sp. SIO1G2]|nr:flagellar basal body L-ring protein FlgH [Sphaerospermopsis sp. SIO1G2]